MEAESEYRQSESLERSSWDAGWIWREREVQRQLAAQTAASVDRTVEIAQSYINTWGRGVSVCELTRESARLVWL